jgi:peptidoglycan L-alanyl-D-glutamate endopeptidase CwlK
MTLPARSLAKLKGVHPDLVAVVLRAAELAPGLFRVTQGVRTIEEQRILKAAGASRTLKSRHIPATSKARPDVAHAIDIVCLLNGKESWHGPLYVRMSRIFKQAARELKVAIEWGGEAFGPRFFDGPHYQLAWKAYP